jgi:hypothetical protein
MGCTAALFVARQDSVWVNYTTHDDDDTYPGIGSENWEAWSRWGHALADTVPAGSTMVWSGLVFLDADFEVQPGGTLVIEPGTKVFALENFDRFNRGTHSTKVEILIRGKASVNGVPGGEVVFSTYGKDATYVPGAGHWGGLTFDLEGADVQAGYGYMGCLQPPSTVQHATIENAEYGMRFTDRCAPTLSNVTFRDISSGGGPRQRDVYLDGTDVVIPYGYFVPGNPPTFVVSPAQWHLTPGTNVVASNAVADPAKEWEYGTTGKADLFVNGGINAIGTATDSISFGPEAPDPWISNNWGGLTHDGVVAGSRLEFVDIGYAANPLILFYPDSITVRDCRVHHFADRGIWVEGTWTGGVVIDSSTVERGTGIVPVLGDTGIDLKEATRARVEYNKVDISGNLILGSSAAVDVYSATSSQVKETPSSCEITGCWDPAPILRDHASGSGAIGFADPRRGRSSSRRTTSRASERRVSRSRSPRTSR